MPSRTPTPLPLTSSISGLGAGAGSWPASPSLQPRPFLGLTVEPRNEVLRRVQYTWTLIPFSLGSQTSQPSSVQCSGASWGRPRFPWAPTALSVPSTVRLRCCVSFSPRPGLSLLTGSAFIFAPLRVVPKEGIRKAWVSELGTNITCKCMFVFFLHKLLSSSVSFLLNFWREGGRCVCPVCLDLSAPLTSCDPEQMPSSLGPP